MGNRRHIFKKLLLSILMFLSVALLAQEPTLSRAQQLYRAQKYDQAAKTIDSAVVHPQTTKDYITWTTRAFIYYYIYIKTDKSKLESSLRDTVLISIRKSITLNPDSDYVSNNKKLLVNLAAHYFNIAKTLLQDSINAERSLVAYKNFKELSRLTDASVDIRAKDIEYNLAVGSVYSDIFNKDNSNTNAQTVAKVALLNVLELQPDNPAANMNLGLLYYNQAVNIIKEMDELEDWDRIDAIQESVVKLAKQSEQFILKVYEKDPSNRKANTALYYIYRMLYDFKKSDEFKKRAEDLGEKFEDKPAEEKKDNQKSNEK